MRYVLALFISLTFLACGGSSKPKPMAYPSWYLNPPQNSGSFLYGVGEGSDINSAKASALSSVSASLSITVSSELKKSESSSSFNGNESSYKSVVNRVKAQVKEMEFNEYQVVKNQVLGEQFLVLVEVSRHKLFNEQKTKLDAFSNALKQEQKNIKKQVPIKQALLLDKSLQKTEKLTSLALLSKSIDATFDTAPYTQQASMLEASKQDAFNKIKISITASNEAEVFTDALKEGLNKAGIQVVTRGANTRVQLKNTFLTDEIYGYKIAKAKLSIATLSSDKTVASNTLALSGKSRYDYKKAKLNAANLLRAKIKKDGIFSVLGIN